MIIRYQLGLLLIITIITGNYTIAANIQGDVYKSRQINVQKHRAARNKPIRLSQLHNRPDYHDEAIEKQQHRLASIKKAHGKNHLYVVHELNELARLYTEQERYREAEPSLKQALEISEKTLGKYHPKVAESLENLALNLEIQKRYAEAESALKQALTIYQKIHGKEHPDVAGSLYSLAMLYQQQGYYAQAEPLFRRVLRIDEKFLGKEHPIVADSLDKLATLYWHQGKYIEAVKLHKQALGIREKVQGKDHPDMASTLNSLGLCYLKQGQYAKAEPLFLRAIAIYEKSHGKEHHLVATFFSNLASLYHYQGRYTEAVKLQKQALAIKKNIFGQDHPNVAISLNNLALLYKDQGNYIDAETLIKQALVIVETNLGKEHPRVATSLNNLAIVYQDQGNYADAETLIIQALSIDEKHHGKEHPDVANSLNNLALIYRHLGRYTKAESLFQRALAIDEKYLGKEHPRVAVDLNNLALVYQNQGRYADAEPLYERAITIFKKIHGNEHPLVAASLKNLATLYQYQGQYVEAEKLHKQALVIRERTLGKEHPDIASGMNSLAVGYLKQGQYAKAEPLLRRALNIFEKKYGKEHPLVAITLINLALMYQYQDQYIDSEKLYKQALAIREIIHGKQHPHVAITLNNMAMLYYKQGRYTEALTYARKVNAIYRHRFIRPQHERSSSQLDERQSVHISFLNHINILGKQLQDNRVDEETLTAEGLEISQLARSTGAAQALAQMATRFAAGGDKLAKRVREHQDALVRWQRLDTLLTRQFSKSPDKRQPDKEIRLRNELAVLDQHLVDLGAALARDFPEYAALSNPAPVELKEIQGLLQADDAILSYLIGEQETYLFVVRKNRIKLHRINLNGAMLDLIVKTLRKGLDSKNMLDASQAIDPKLEYHDLKPYKIPHFNVELAYALYQKLIAPAEPLLEGVKHVMVIPDGALTSLPFGVLVTEKPSSAITQLRQYRHVPWLTKRYALSTLPSIGALRVLRHFAKRSKADQPLVGFGDPLLGAEAASNLSARGRSIQALLRRGPIADADTVRNAFKRLPGTQQELLAMADTLNTRPDSLYLQERATEAQVRSMTLSSYRVVAFATHGLMAGEFKGLAEPALVLTPPKIASKDDDGLLTASEVARLKLNADWVILSACNTAAADGTPGAQGLSGLARSFFYAGSRALLVSHWYVVSDSTVQLQTAMFSELAGQPGLGRAEALRRAQLKLIQQKNKPYFAHPMFWAPFVVVGEGSAG
jgi:tetratricopeptide (TPR) repeat protein